MIKKIALVLTAMMMMESISAVCASAKPEDRTLIYVAADGNDSNDGSKDKPFATVKKAQEKLRSLKKSGNIGKAGAVIYLREGTYQFFDGIELNSEDSGEDGAPTVFRGYPGENVRIIGGMNIPVKLLKKTTDSAMLDRVIESKYKDKIYEVNLYDAGMKEIPKMFMPETYGLSYVKDHGNDPNGYSLQLMKKLGIDISKNAFEVFVDSEVFNNARYPDADYMTISKVISSYNYWESPDGRSLEEILQDEIKGTGTQKAVFVPSDDKRAKLWASRDLDQVYMWIKSRYGWADEANMVKSIDSSTGAITCAHPTHYGPFQEGNPLYIYNFFDEISNKEFYIDRTGGMLYLCLDKRPEQLEDICISTLEQPMFDVQDAKNIEIKNIHMSMTRGECVYMKNCENVVVDNCEFSFTTKKQHSVYIDEGSTYCGVKNSYFHDVNGGMYIWSGDKETLTPGNCYIINCEFENFARLNKTYCSAFSLEGVGNRAAYNEIHGAEHMSAGWGGNYQVMEFNEFYDVCTDTDDAAAIYAGRSLTPRGNIIRYNYLHEIGRKGQIGGQANGAHGIYLDDGYSSAYVIGNVLENVANYGVFEGGGRDNVIFNNVIINCGNGIFCDSRFYGKDAWNDQRIEGLLNTPYWKNDIWKEAFPELYNMDIEQAGVPAGNVFENNLMYNSGGLNIYAEAAENSSIKNNWITNEDPGFYDAENRNYLFKEDAQVYKKIDGFLPIPFTRMGRCIKRAEQRALPATIIAIDSPVALVNGEERRVDENENITPIIVNNKTYLPLRFLAESNGFLVDYEDETKNAVIMSDSDELKINIVTGETYKNGEKAESLEPIVVEGRTLLPMRAISEMLSKKVFWDDRGFVSVSDIDELFNSETDSEIIDYLFGMINIY